MKFLHVIRYSLWLVWQVVVAATDVVLDTLRPNQKQQPIQGCQETYQQPQICR